MTWTTTAGYNPGTVNFVIIDRDGGGSNHVPLSKPVYGADSADPTRVTISVGLPVVAQRTIGAPTTARVANATASSGSTGNGAALASGGSAVPGLFKIVADPDNATVVTIGDSNASAGSGFVRGESLQPGQATIVHTDDLRAWKLAVRTANDAVSTVLIG